MCIHNNSHQRSAPAQDHHAQTVSIQPPSKRLQHPLCYCAIPCLSRYSVWSICSRVRACGGFFSLRFLFSLPWHNCSFALFHQWTQHSIHGFQSLLKAGSMAFPLHSARARSFLLRRALASAPSESRRSIKHAEELALPGLQILGWPQRTSCTFSHGAVSSLHVIASASRGFPSFGLSRNRTRRWKNSQSELHQVSKRRSDSTYSFLPDARAPMVPVNFPSELTPSFRAFRLYR